MTAFITASDKGGRLFKGSAVAGIQVFQGPYLGTVSKNLGEFGLKMGKFGLKMGKFGSKMDQFGPEIGKFVLKMGKL